MRLSYMVQNRLSVTTLSIINDCTFSLHRCLVMPSVLGNSRNMGENRIAIQDPFYVHMIATV